MSSIAAQLHAHAAALTERELARRGSPVLVVTPERRAAVAEIAASVAAELADAVLEHARTTPVLASALISLYGGEGGAGSSSLVESVPGAAD
jgi:uncharacterized membrane protein